MAIHGDPNAAVSAQSVAQNESPIQLGCLCKCLLKEKKKPDKNSKNNCFHWYPPSHCGRLV
jgi:hypothetical protein